MRLRKKVTILVTLFIIGLTCFCFKCTIINSKSIPTKIQPHKITRASVIYQAYIKNANVTLHCYSDEVEGYGRYEIVSVSPLPIIIPINFMHFYWEYFFHNGTQITSVKINGSDIPYSIDCFYNNDCQNEATFTIQFNPNETQILEATWHYNPQVSNMYKTYLLGYVIFSEGWNRSIMHEEVRFFFHSKVFLHANKINLYSKDFDFQVSGSSGCNLNKYEEDNCANQKQYLRYLSRISDRTILKEDQEVPYFQYCDYNIEHNHNLLIIHLGLDTNILFWVGSGILGLLTVVFIIGTVYLKKHPPKIK